MARNYDHLLPTYKHLYERMRQGDKDALESTIEYQLYGLDRHGQCTWAGPRLVKGLVGRSLLVAEQVEHESFVDRMAITHPGCPTAQTARKTVAIAFHPVGLPCLQVTVWLQHFPPHRR
jgi:hypothetical protein